MSSSDDPRQRLLEAAGQIFAERGFEGATVRDLCQRAEVNLAAVNYYFRDKERLYIEAVKHAACGAVQDPPWPVWTADTPPADRLREFIHVLVTRLLATDRPAWHARLMMREMTQPTSACRELVQEYIQPLSEVLQGVLKDVLPPDTPRWKRFLTGFSIVGQCLYHLQNRPVAQILVGEEDYRHFEAATVAAHIAEFSLAALGLGAPVGTTSNRS